MAILDLNMPGMNGREIAKQIREEEQRLGIQSDEKMVIICSSSVEIEHFAVNETETEQHKYFDYFIPKPITFESLRVPMLKARLLSIC